MRTYREEATVDPADRPTWVDGVDNPYLHGPYTPVISEITAVDLRVETCSNRFGQSECPLGSAVLSAMPWNLERDLQALVQSAGPKDYSQRSAATRRLVLVGPSENIVPT